MQRGQQLRVVPFRSTSGLLDDPPGLSGEVGLRQSQQLGPEAEEGVAAAVRLRDQSVPSRGAAADEESARKAGFLRWDADKGGSTAITVAAIADVPAGRYGKGSAEAGDGGSGPLGWLIKGNADSMLFHGPDSPAYDQTIAEVWFFDEETARAAGFDKWDKNFK